MKWTKQQDFIALFLYRLKQSNLLSQSIFDHHSNKAAIKPGTLKMRMSNFQFLYGEGGLSHPAKMSRATFAEFGHKGVDELKKIALDMLSDSPNNI